MEERHIWLMLGGFLSALLLFLGLEFLLPTPTPAAELNIPWVPGPVTTVAGHIQTYDPLPKVPGLFGWVDLTWLPPHVTTKAAIIGRPFQWRYVGPMANYAAHCSAAQRDPKVPKGLLQQACNGLLPDIPFLPLQSRVPKPREPQPWQPNPQFPKVK